MSNSLKLLIEDGYTLEHTFPACEFHPELNIRFRPATQSERTRQNKEAVAAGRKEQHDKVDSLAAEFIANHLHSWEDAEGNSVGDISAVKVARLHPNLLNQVYEIVYGTKPAIAKEREDDLKNSEAG